MRSNASYESLDLSKILSEHDCGTGGIFGASITFLSMTDSLQSSSAIPSFPSFKKLPLFANLSGLDTLSSKSRTRTGLPVATATVPTIPRMKTMLMEPIAITRWAESLPPRLLPHHEPPNIDVTSDDHVPLTWIPAGSIFSPEVFRSMFRGRKTSCSDSWSLIIKETLSEVDVPSSADASRAELIQNNPPVIAEAVKNKSDRENTSQQDAEEGPVPTIMLSTSTAAVPLSLESSQSLAQPLTLAARRGHLGPSTLPLPLSPATKTDLYPGIPTPFLGSPSGYSPQFEFSSGAEDFSMDLEAMCQDLRSRCPPLSPTSPIISTEIGYLSKVSSEVNGDSDEWDFARELLETHIECVEASSPLQTPVKPALLTEQGTLDDSAGRADPDYSWSTDQTLTNSPASVEHTESHASEKIPAVKSSLPETSKQQRRRTVIIETPRNSVMGMARPVRMTVDLSHLADADDSAYVAPTVDEVPFEKADGPLSPVTPFAESTPYSRPISSASMGRPVRSILKTREKKSVRFSELPSMHEYSDEHELESIFEGDEQDTEVKTPRRKRAATTPAFRSRRKSALQSSPEVDEPRRSSFPKHPAVKSRIRSNSPAPPEIVTPTPINRQVKAGRQSLQPRAVDKLEVGRPRRLTGVPTNPRVSLPADTKQSRSLRKKQSMDESQGKKANLSDSEKSPTAVQRSRMPFKSILTKFRA